jgi:esterase/lipase superfamily enzyme
LGARADRLADDVDHRLLDGRLPRGERADSAPGCLDGCVAISGLYQLRTFIGDCVDDAVYFNSPLLSLPGLDDAWYLDRLRAATICLVAGQGAWDEDMLADTRAMGEVLAAKDVPAIIDIWGTDVNHDWPWWRRMLPFELERMGV